jgi:hypothetical protein
MKRFLYAMLLIISLWIGMLAGCSDATVKNWQTFGDSATVTLYACDGSTIKIWESTGKVATETQSDGWRFVDKKTGKLIRVSGTIVIEN